jgi:hypothetical protein
MNLSVRLTTVSKTVDHYSNKSILSLTPLFRPKGRGLILHLKAIGILYGTR